MKEKLFVFIHKIYIKGLEKSEDIKSAVSQSSVVPLTHVRTPEEVTGVKSPDPENWTVPIESSERLQWSGVNTTDKDSSSGKISV